MKGKKRSLAERTEFMLEETRGNYTVTGDGHIVYGPADIEKAMKKASETVQ